MIDCCIVSESLSRLTSQTSCTLSVQRSSNLEDDFAFVVEDLAKNSVKAKRLIVYCRSLDMCANSHFGR